MADDIRFNLGIPHWMLSSNTASTRTLDATGEKLAVVFIAPATGNLRTIEFNNSTASLGGGNPTFDVRVETVAATGLPSGTLWDTNTNAALTISSTADTIQSVTLTADAAVTAGDLVAIVIDCTAGGATQSATFRNRWAIASNGFPMALQDTSGAYARETTKPNLGVLYDDGTAALGLTGGITSGNQAYASNTGTADEYGNLFTYSRSVDIIGIRAMLTAGLTADFDLKLYTGAAAASSAVATISVDADALAQTGQGFIEVYFPAVTVAASTQIRVSALPTTTNSLTLPGFTFLTSAKRLAFGGIAQRTRRLDAGTWSELDTTIMAIEPIVSGQTISAGSAIIAPGSGRFGVQES